MEAIVQASLSILRKNLAQPFTLTLLNIGATKFSAPLNKERGVPKAFKNFFEAPAGAVAGTVSQQAAGVVGVSSSVQILADGAAMTPLHAQRCSDAPPWS